jgi:hypothetical protein
MNFRELDLLDQENNLKPHNSDTLKKLVEICQKIMPILFSTICLFINSEKNSKSIQRKRLMAAVVCLQLCGMRNPKQNYWGKLLGATLLASGLKRSVLDGLLAPLRLTVTSKTLESDVYSHWTSSRSKLFNQKKKMRVIGMDNWQKFVIVRTQSKKWNSKMYHGVQTVVMNHASSDVIITSVLHESESDS